MIAMTETTDSDRQMCELDALNHEDHPHFLAVDFTPRETEFLNDLRDRRDRRGDLSSPGLSCRQAGWLQAIHRKAAGQCRQADDTERRTPIDMSRYHVGA